MKWRFNKFASHNEYKSLRCCRASSQPIFLSSGAFPKARKGCYDYGKSLWKPGEQCPVPGCFSVILQRVGNYTRHWKERHVFVVSKFECPFCQAHFKRAGHLAVHLQGRHGTYYDPSEHLTKIEEVNTQYIDPKPLTLTRILGLY